MKKEKREVADPLYKLGYGIVAFRDMLWSLFWLFVLFSILSYFQIQIYETGTAYDLSLTTPFYESRSIGNLGYSTVNCQIMP